MQNPLHVTKKNLTKSLILEYSWGFGKFIQNLCISWIWSIAIFGNQSTQILSGKNLHLSALNFIPLNLKQFRMCFKRFSIDQNII